MQGKFTALSRSGLCRNQLAFLLGLYSEFSLPSLGSSPKAGFAFDILMTWQIGQSGAFNFPVTNYWTCKECQLPPHRCCGYLPGCPEQVDLQYHLNCHFLYFQSRDLLGPRTGHVPHQLQDPLEGQVCGREIVQHFQDRPPLPLVVPVQVVPPLCSRKVLEPLHLVLRRGKMRKYLPNDRTRANHITKLSRAVPLRKVTEVVRHLRSELFLDYVSLRFLRNEE
jgi:hypothetical protein